jgi:hypothetical protein
MARAAVQPAAKAAAKTAAKKSTPAAKAKTASRTASRATLETPSITTGAPAGRAKGRAAAAKPAAAGERPVARRAAGDGAAVSQDKQRLVRDSFTMPEREYAVLAEVKQACLKAGFEIKKSELLRIGVALISQIDLATLQSVLASLPQLKTGRPRSS